MTDAIHSYLFNEEQRASLWHFLLPRKELYTITYGAASILPALFAKKVYFLKSVEYEQKRLVFFVEENRTPYVFRFLLATIFLLFSLLSLPLVLCTHVLVRWCKRGYFLEHRAALIPHR